jgi:hypothetical protein
VKTRVDARLRLEARRYSLRFVCEECIHFDASLQSCANGYPAAPRREELERECELAFCKEFELG